MDTVLVGIVALIGGLLGGYAYSTKILQRKSGSAAMLARQEVEKAESDAKAIKAQAELDAKDLALRIRSESEAEARQRAGDVAKKESRIDQREETLNQSARRLESKERSIAEKEARVDEAKASLEGALTRHEAELTRVAGMSRAEAHGALVQEIENDAKRDAMTVVRDIEAKAREEAERRARKIIAIAIQRVASEETTENSTSVVNLPNDEMKGRIIGREGRNIRAFESVTGSNILIDDTPGSVVVSCFDPVRREEARLTLERLISDGRIQPGRIEETHLKSKNEVEKSVREAGEWAVMEVGLVDVHPEMVKVLGRLNFRSSYGQNVLKHLVEAAQIAGIIAAELGTDVMLAKRCTLLHDIGKAISHEVEGSHAMIGAELARRLKEKPEVCHAIEAHHGEVEQETVEAVITQTADAISSARPGARRETLETYVKRLERLEAIGTSFDGVEKCFAMQAGREVRIMVKPADIDDLQAEVLARDVAKKIEEELQYPGQIKVTVIREHRAVEFAK